MEKKKYANWKTKVESIYQRDREDRLREAYEVALPEVKTRLRQVMIKGGKENEKQYSNVRASI